MPAKMRGFRSPDETWDPAMETAKEMGEDLSKVINRFLEDYPLAVPRCMVDLGAGNGWCRLEQKHRGRHSPMRDA